MQSTKPILAIANRSLLVLNSILFVFLIVLCLRPGGCLDRAQMARLTQDTAKTLGQDVYVARYPFVLLVSKDFPKDDAFTMLHYAAPLFLFLQVASENADGAELKEALLGVGKAWSFSCRYSLANGDPEVRELVVIREREDVAETFTDLNADGMPDFRQSRDLRNGVSRVFVWYESAWHEILDAQEDPNQDRYHKRLLSGERVSFDAESGKWVGQKLQTTP